MLLTADVTDALDAAAEPAATTVAGKIDEQISGWAKMWEQFWPNAFNYSIKIVLGLIFLLIGRLFIKLILKLIKKAFDKSKVEKGVVSFAMSLTKGVLYVLLIIMIAGILGIPTASLIALIGSAGLAIGLALQGSLSNFAGGVLIMVLKPFKVGDYIVTPNGEGTVTGIDIFYTKLTTPDNRGVVIPNGTLSNSAITNVSKEKIRRVDLTIPVSYDSDIRKVREVLNGVLDAQGNKILKEKDRDIFVSEFADSSINMVYRFWVNSGDYWAVRFAVLELVKERFAAEKIEIPFNQLDVNIKK